ncbi:MAG TPA: flagellar basal body rod protein FlgB [Phycisphaerales bacterium]|nr:flagellar basal body rod protein FlgB [Phycisphaerales bacterium]
MIEGLQDSGAIGALSKVLQFTAQRQRIIANNIANLSTPGFRPTDVSVEEFQQQLSDALDEQRTSGSANSALVLRDTQEVHDDGGRMVLEPQPIGDNIMFHDGNDRNVESTMQDLVENFMAFRTAASLMKKQFDTINLAISGRV